MEYYQQAWDIQNKLTNTDELINELLRDKGNMYRELGEIDMALRYYNKALQTQNISQSGVESGVLLAIEIRSCMELINKRNDLDQNHRVKK